MPDIDWPGWLNRLLASKEKPKAEKPQILADAGQPATN
jgi:hypothetical protein